MYSSSNAAADSNNLNMLLNAVSANTNANSAGNNMRGGGSLSQDVTLLSGMDPAKLNMMINQLANTNNITNAGMGGSQFGNNMNNFNLNNLGGRGGGSAAGGGGITPQSASALLMNLSGSNLQQFSNSMNVNFNQQQVNMGGGYQQQQQQQQGGGTGNSGSTLGGIPRRATIQHGPIPAGMFTTSSTTTNNNNDGSSREPLVRQTSLPLGIGSSAANDPNMNSNSNMAMGNGSTNNQAVGGGGQQQANAAATAAAAAAASLPPKKQKKFNPPAHLQYPPISLIPPNESDKSNNKRQSSSGGTSPRSPSSGRQRRSSSPTNPLSRSSSTANFMTPEDTIGNRIARACARHSGQKILSLKNHYGLQCQIREWISMALTRRSFALLSKASSLANRCGIHMDRILCGVADDDKKTSNKRGRAKQHLQVAEGSVGRRMSYLLATLLEPRDMQTIPITERHMLKPNLPKEFLSLVGCQSCPTFQPNELRNRWIIIRETHKGVTRFYCSPAFERNVLCWTHISQIYEDNLADINSLIFVKDEFRKFLACNAHQISLHSTAGMPPRPVHAPKTKIRLLGRQWGQANYGDKSWKKVSQDMIREVQDGTAMTLEMDLRFVSFPTMDKTTYYLEFFHHSRDGTTSSTGTPASWTRNMSDDNLNETGNVAAAAAAAASQQQQTPAVRFESNAAGGMIVSESPGREDPPMFDDVVDCEDWVGINDVLASGDIDDLITALLD